MKEFTQQSCDHIIKHAIENKIGAIVVGDWGDMKRGLKMQRKVSQKFQQIPYAGFKNKLRLKCELNGIEYIETNESYTSQTCFNCRKRRKANRVHRGLYRCNNCGIERNADINAAINILRKVFPEKVSNLQWDSGDIISPLRVNV